MILDVLGGFQQIVMLAVIRLGDDAYGAKIQQELERTAGRSVTISTIYVTMDRLKRRGFIETWLADPTPVRGGKAKRYYRVTREGLHALRGSRLELTKMWDGVDIEPEPES